MQIKTTMSNHNIYIRMAKSEKGLTTTNVAKDVKQLVYIVNGNVKWHNYFGEKTLVISFLKKHVVILLLGIKPRKRTATCLQETCRRMSRSFLLMITKSGNNSSIHQQGNV